MTVHVTIAGAVLRAKRTVMSFGVLAILALFTVTGCTLGGSTSSSSPTHYPRTATATSTGTATNAAAGSSATGNAATGSATSGTPTGSSSPHPASSSSTGSPAPTSNTSAPASPTGPPQTGGGGTAGLQDTMLFGLGGAAILAGAASIAYRRRLTRGGR
jgi:hypothetical protein